LFQSGPKACSTQYSGYWIQKAIPAGTAKAGARVKMKPEKTKTNITYFVSLATHRRLKQHALDNNTSLQQILDEALDMYCSVHALPPIERATGAKE
jgi:hypothetical protein